MGKCTKCGTNFVGTPENPPPDGLCHYCERDVLRAGIKAVGNLINNSHGIIGLHLNGDTAPWSELQTGGRFETWLLDFDEANKLLPKQNPPSL
jgi:hypothetical protein